MKKSRVSRKKSQLTESTKHQKLQVSKKVTTKRASRGKYESATEYDQRDNLQLQMDGGTGQAPTQSAGPTQRAPASARARPRHARRAPGPEHRAPGRHKERRRA